jgi:hypothetical protein
MAMQTKVVDVKDTQQWFFGDATHVCCATMMAFCIARTDGAL